ncbi:hypothetical protein ACX6FB_002562 [Vibrio cholerae]
MPVQELVTDSTNEMINGYEVLEVTGKTGNIFTNISIWITAKRSAGIIVKDVTCTVLVAGNNGKGWLAFEEVLPNGTVLRTVFETF